MQSSVDHYNCTSLSDCVIEFEDSCVSEFSDTLDPNWCGVDESKLLYFLREQDSVLALAYWTDHMVQERPGSVDALMRTLTQAIAKIDQQLNAQVNEILHSESLQKLEASWRGVLYLLEQAEVYDREQKVKVKLISISWNELAKDLNRAIEFDQSEFFKHIYENEFDMPGGEPFGVILGDYKLSHTVRKGNPYNDVEVLKEISKACAAAFSPFIASVDSSFFGVNSYSELGQVADLTNQFKQHEYLRWSKLRDIEDSRFIGLVLPNVLMRSPYKHDGRKTFEFNFREELSDPEAHYLWGNACYAFGAVLVRAFSESGWFAQIRGLQAGTNGFGLVNELPRCAFETDIYRKSVKPSVNLQVGHKFESELADNGFIPLCSVPYSDKYVFYSNSSVQKAKRYRKSSADINSRLSSMLQYILCVSRFAHYIKVINRDKVGGYQSAKECEKHLQNWLYQYTTATEDASNEVRARHPLRNAQIQVKEKPGEPGKYFSIIQMQPHFQLEQMLTTVKLVAELSPKHSSQG